MTGQRIVYGWHPGEGPHWPDGHGLAHVAHVECASNRPPWMDIEADASLAGRIDMSLIYDKGKGPKHVTCERCCGLLTEPPQDIS